MTGGLVLQLILLAVTCGMLYFSRRQAAFSPLRMFLYGWVIVLGAAVSGLVVYGRGFAVITFVLVLGTLVAFTIGTSLAPELPDQG